MTVSSRSRGMFILTPQCNRWLTYCSILTHGAIAKKKEDEEESWFRSANSVWRDFEPKQLYDLCLLRLGHHVELPPGNSAGQGGQASLSNTTPAPVWPNLPPPLPVSNNAPSAAMAPPVPGPSAPTRPEYFLLGYPVGLPLKISAHGQGVSSPRILRPVQGFNATFNCDLDALRGKIRLFLNPASCKLILA